MAPGWSTKMYSEFGYEATGIDLNPSRFEVASNARCQLTYGSGTEIPFDDESFEIVSCYQCLEHISQPEKALRRCCAFARKGGVVFIVGPNLISPITGLIYLSKPRSWNQLKWRAHRGHATSSVW